jgi:hypothetical protein
MVLGGWGPPKFIINPESEKEMLEQYSIGSPSCFSQWLATSSPKFKEE